MRGSRIALGGLILIGAAGVANANECYRRVVEPAQYQTVAETVMVEPERQIPEYVPAVARRVAETVVVEPERTVTRVVPAVYEAVNETVLVRPATREWRVRNHYGEMIGCWVDVPAQYATRQRTVEVSPSRYVEETIPARYATRVRTEIVEPARTVYRTIPARYATRERVEMVAPASARWAPASGYCEHSTGY